MRNRFARQVPKKRAGGVAELKARDLIPGWPRGRSTQAQHGWLSTESYNWHLPLRVNRVEGAYVAEIARGERGAFARACEDEARLFAEARENSAYHAAQAEMVDKWHSNCRRIPGLAQLRLEFEEVGVVLEVKHRRPGALVFEVVGWVPESRHWPE